MIPFTFRNSDNFWLLSGWLIAGFVFLRLRSANLTGKRFGFFYLVFGTIMIIPSFEFNGIWRTLIGLSISTMLTVAMFWSLYSLVKLFARRVAAK